MAIFKHLVVSAVALCGLSRVSACSCVPPGTLCDTIQDSDIVLRVKAVSMVQGADINDDAVYTLETVEVFEAEEPGPNEYDEVGATFEMTTGGNSALCGVYMLTDGSTEYVLNMYRNTEGTLYAAGICDLFQVWDEDLRAELEAGCDDYDPCDGTCSESQECLRTYGFYSEIEYYCSDTCDPNPCPEGTACTLDYPACDGEVCAAEAVCGGEETMTPSTSPPIFTPGPGDIPSVAPGQDDDGIDERTTASPSAAPQVAVTFAPSAGDGSGGFGALTLNPVPASSSAPSLAPSEDDVSRGTELATTSFPSAVPDSGDGDTTPFIPADATSSPTTTAEAGANGDTGGAAARLPKLLSGGGGLVASMAAALAVAALFSAL